ncbi:substrate-binding domain-containing protein [Paeniglutamicibacter sp. R2-26]|uniref:LacI family DNA-binding transcriptional regulator n=1 Tax=Paeniglutamicibacter sp. R2-26 TaxID=3144417 RepID=UPI003EE68992
MSEERQNRILRELALRGSLNAADFARSLGISGMTVRRDLALLEEQGALQRVHGGAVAVAERFGDSGGFTQRNAGRGGGFAGQGFASGKPSPLAHGQRPLATIGMVVPSAKYYFPGVIRGAEAAASELGVRLVLGVSNYSPVEEQRQVKRLLMSGVDGLLVTPSVERLAGTPTLDLLASAEVPVVVVERSIGDVLDAGRLESVQSDHVRGAEIAVTHLLSLGHRRIALCTRQNSPTASQVEDGYRLSMQHAGLASDAALVGATFDTSDPEKHREQMNGIVEGFVEAGATAAIIHNDEDALTFADLCEARGLRIPEDIAVVAYDDEVAALGAVPLSAVAPPKFDVGYHALQMCLNRLGPRRRWDLAVQRVSLSPTLVVRDSTAA